MAYCTSADILLILDSDTLVQLTDDANTGSVDTDVVNRAIADVDEEIDAYLSVRYSLPLSATPGLVRRLSAQMAVYQLYARKGEVPQAHKDRAAAAVQLLDRLAKGQVKLDVPEPAEAVADGPQVSTSETDRIFTRGSGSANGTLDNY
jgi:phage gp36-like protein